MYQRAINKLLNFFTKGDARSLTVKKNMLASIALKGISVAITFLLVPATIGYVDSEIYGVWLTLSAILVWFQFLDIGLAPGLKNRLTEALAAGDMQKSKSLVSTTYFATAAIFIPLAVIGVCVSPFISWGELLNVNAAYEHEIVVAMQVLSVFICLQMVANVVVSVLAAYQRVAFSQSFLVMGNVLAYILILILSHTVPPSLPILAAVLAGSPIAVTIIGSVILYSNKYREVAPSFSHARVSEVKNIFSLGIKFFIINAQAVIVYQSANLLISHVSSPESVTSYNIAYKYLSIAMLLYTTITVPLWPAYTDAYARGDREWMKATKIKMNKLLILCGAICVAFAFLAPLVYHIWIGDKAYVPPMMTWAVCAYVISYCFMTLNGTFIIGIGKVFFESVVVSIGAIVYIPAALFAAKFFAEYGIVLALVIINLVYGVLFAIQANKLISGTARGIWNK